eukprot:EG_transcript_4370
MLNETILLLPAEAPTRGPPVRRVLAAALCAAAAVGLAVAATVPAPATAAFAAPAGVAGPAAVRLTTTGRPRPPSSQRVMRADHLSTNVVPEPLAHRIGEFPDSLTQLATATWGQLLVGAAVMATAAALAIVVRLVQQSASSRLVTRMLNLPRKGNSSIASCAATGEIAGAAPICSAEAGQEAIRRAAEGLNFHKRITLLGSTGSIGTQTLDIVETLPQNYSIVGLAAGSNLDLLVQQCVKFRPQIVAIRDEYKLEELKTRLAAEGVQAVVVGGEEGVVECARYGDSDTVVTGIVGCAGLLPTIAAIEAGKDIALANKETLIAAGPVVLPLLKKHNVRMLPADSEHSAIFQSLQGAPPEGLSKVILTASGGAFRDWRVEDLKKVTLQDALKHPNWSMGAKITIDSATLMNKGLEVIEAHYLFGKSYDDIEVVVHPQSIIHSMVEYADTSVIAQLGWPDMRLPLLYSMAWPHRIKMPWDRLDFVKVGQLTFKAPDLQKYPCLGLAYRAGRTGGTMPCALNAANEQAVELFRQGQIHYLDIPRVIEAVMDAHEPNVKENPILGDILEIDAWARSHAKAIFSKVKGNYFSLA